MHTKTKMNILFKNKMDTANYLEEKTQAEVGVGVGVGVGVS